MSNTCNDNGCGTCENWVSAETTDNVIGTCGMEQVNFIEVLDSWPQTLSSDTCGSFS